MLTPTKASNNMTYDSKTTSFNFPFETLTPILGEPTNATITILKRQIYANAMENACTLGCGTLGYLGIIMPERDFRNKQLSIHPGTQFQPFTIPVQDPQADDDEQKEQRRALRDYVSMDSKLKQQILAAIEVTYISEIQDAEVGFAAVNAKAILEHLITEYGMVTLEDLYANTEHLNSPWNSEQPIRLLWDRITECQRISIAGGEALTDKMAMYTVLKLLDATGLYGTYTTGWRQANPLQTTWTMPAFREFFNHADKDRKKNLTVKDAGFHGANAAVKGPKTETTVTNAARPTTNFSDPTSGKKIYYCWSHGGSLNSTHTSSTCKYPKEGHQKEATWMDMMNGCCEMKFGKNKKAPTPATTTTE